MMINANRHSNRVPVLLAWDTRNLTLTVHLQYQLIQQRAVSFVV